MNYKYKNKKGISSIFNLTCQWSQIFFTKNIGSLKDKFATFDKQTNYNNNVDDWKNYVLNDLGEEKINEMKNDAWKMFNEIRNNINEITKEDISEYIDNIIFDKTFSGLKKESIILKEIAKKENYHYKDSSSEEEKNGIDGWLNNYPIQVKPLSYKSMSHNNYLNKYKIFIIYYNINNNKTKYIFNKKEFENFYK